MLIKLLLCLTCGLNFYFINIIKAMKKRKIFYSEKLKINWKSTYSSHSELFIPQHVLREVHVLHVCQLFTSHGQYFT